MVRFEREVVGAMVDSAPDDVRGQVEAFVDRALAVMPAHIRLPIVTFGAVLAVWERVNPRGLLRSGSRVARAARVGSWEASRLAPTRQYARMFRSLTLFADNELRQAGAR